MILAGIGASLCYIAATSCEITSSDRRQSPERHRQKQHDALPDHERPELKTAHLLPPRKEPVPIGGLFVSIALPSPLSSVETMQENLCQMIFTEIYDKWYFN
jgi:hypothetical protein